MFLLNSIPGVGHVKAIYHYTTGDRIEGDKVMAEATRSTIVIGAGVVGSVAGPAGAMAAGAAGGALCDSVASVIKKKPVGYIDNMLDIGTHVKNGEIPLMATAKVAFKVTEDTLGGLGGGLASSIVQNSAKKTVTSIAPKLIGDTLIRKTAGAKLATEYTEKVVDVFCGSGSQNYPNNGTTSNNKRSDGGTRKPNPPRNPKKQSSNKKSDAIEGTPDPPRDPNERNNKKGIQSSPQGKEDLWGKFLEIMRKSKFGTTFFEKLSKEQIPYLKLLIKKMKFGGREQIETIIQIVTILLDELQIDFTLEHFISLISFAMVYIKEQMVKEQNTNPSHHEVENQDDLENELFGRVIRDGHLISSMKNIIKELRKKIEGKKYSPKFREIYCAIYHYYKHRHVGNGNILSVDEYFDLIERAIEELKKSEEYSEFQKGKKHRVSHTMDTAYGKITIVLKRQGGLVVVSTCFIIYSFSYT